MDVPDIPEKMQRVTILGSTGSGKSTLSAQLAAILGCPHLELDSFRFLPQWQVRSNDEFHELIDAATSQPCWVVDGNYRVIRDLTWGRADTLIWLDYRLSLILWRLTRRTVGRTINRTDLWNTGNRDNIFKHFRLSDESLYYWMFKTYWRRKRELPEQLALPEHAHLRVLRFSNPRQTAAWVNAAKAALQADAPKQ
jgi:adenylate kinase family enzyme